MVKKVVLLIFLVAFLPLAANAQDVLVTRNFSGAWDQPEQESQGLALLVIEQGDDKKVGIAYWFTYGDDAQSAWFIGIGPVEGNTITMNLKQGSGVGFLQDDEPGNENFVSVGSMVIEFYSCNAGMVTFETEIETVGSGSFPIERITELYKVECSGGVSDDVDHDMMPHEFEIDLYPVVMGSPAKGEAEFEQDAHETEFKVKVDHMLDGNYRIFVGGEDRGELVVFEGEGKTEFASPADDDEILLTFDPRGQLIEIYDDQGGLVLASDGEMMGPGDDDDDDDDHGMLDYGDHDIEVEMLNTGVYPGGKAEAEFESDSDDAEFKVEIDDVPAGNYPLHVGGEYVGTISAYGDDHDAEGQLEFSDPVEPDSLLLDFDPRGQTVEILEDGTVIFEVLFPTD